MKAERAATAATAPRLLFFQLTPGGMLIRHQIPE
jgi:hypothetical protein